MMLPQYWPFIFFIGFFQKCKGSHTMNTISNATAIK